MENLKDFNICSDELYYLIDDTKNNLLKNNVEYQKLQNRMSEIIEKHPIIDKIFYPANEELDRELTKEESKMLQKVMDIYSEVSNFEEQEIFFLGGKIAYIYFKNMGLIKD